MPFTKRNWSSDGPTVPARAREPVDALSMSASPQDQSPLFKTLPIEIRRHIYKQLWLDYGITQHILALTPKAYLQSYPCILSREELDQEPTPAPPPRTDVAGDDEAAVDGTEASPDGNNEQDQPQPHDDPGDIDGALLELSGGDSPAGQEQPPDTTPWCAHYTCFRRWSQKYGHSFMDMYTAAYKSALGARPDLAASVVLTAFLVCRRVYQEAAESLFSSMRFSFDSVTALRSFLGQVPRPLVSRIQFANIVAVDMEYLFDDGSVDTRTPAQHICERLSASFPNLRELRLTLHSIHHVELVPGKHDLEPLYALARERGTRLRRFEVFLPARCDGDSDLGYGEVPSSLRDDAPFTAKVVPPGWHELSGCTPFKCPIRSSQD